MASSTAQIQRPVFRTAEMYDARGTDLTGQKPYGIAIADLVGPAAPNYQPDGWQDVVVAVRTSSGVPGYSGRVIIYRNTGNWADDGQNLGLVQFAQIEIPIFCHPPTEWKPRPPYDISCLDMDNDGDRDLILTTAGDLVQGTGLVPPAAVWIIRNNGNGTFTLLFDQGAVWPYPKDFRGWHYPGLVVQDYDLDGLYDVACGGGQDVSPYKAATHVFPNVGDLVLGADVIWSNSDLPVTYGTAVVAKRLRITTPRVDLAMSLEDIQDATFILLNGGGGDFTENSVQDGKRGYGLAVTQFRVGLEAMDMVSTYWNVLEARARVMFLDNNGDVIDGSGVDYLLQHTNPPKQAWGVATARFNNDVTEDFVVAFEQGGPWGGGAVAVFVNYPTNPGTFRTPPYYFDTHPAGSPQPTFVKTGDLNNDGHTDLVVANTNSNTVAVLLNGLVTIVP